jgi:hypothetical protein
MKHLNNFLLESEILVDFPPEGLSVSQIESLPEYKRFEEISGGNRIESRKTSFTFSNIPTSTVSYLYPFRVTKQNITYGTLRIKSKYLVLDSWPKILDYMSVYAVSKQIGVNSETIERFAFNGLPMTNNTIIKISLSKLNKIVEIAEKYNSPEKRIVVDDMKKSKEEIEKKINFLINNIRNRFSGIPAEVIRSNNVIYIEFDAFLGIFPPEITKEIFEINTLIRLRLDFFDKNEYLNLERFLKIFSEKAEMQYKTLCAYKNPDHICHTIVPVFQQIFKDLVYNETKLKK